MTTYVTIPTASNSSPPANLEFVSLVNERIRSGLRKRRPWAEMMLTSFFSIPPSFDDALQRIYTNLSYFRINYAIVSLLILFLSLLWHPISLIVFIVMMAAWLFLCFLRDKPLVLLGRVIDDRIVLVVLSVLTLLFLFLTDVIVNIDVSLVIGVVVVLLHAAVRRTDDFDYEAGTRVVYCGLGLRLPLKDTASSSFSS